MSDLTKVLTVRVPVKDADRLAKLAKRRKVTISVVVRDILAEQLKGVR